MATMAGALNVRLEKKGQYALNKAGKSPDYTAIRVGHDVVQLAGFLAVLVAIVATCVR